MTLCKMRPSNLQYVPKQQLLIHNYKLQNQPQLLYIWIAFFIYSSYTTLDKILANLFSKTLYAVLQIQVYQIAVQYILNAIPPRYIKELNSTYLNSMEADNKQFIKNSGIYPLIDLEKQYANYKNVLKGAEMGKVCTRFAPEPSGYLHVGHLKSSLLSYHYAKMYNGKFIIRFDDTNPSKEKDQYVNSIIQDLALLGMKHDLLTYSSDYFQQLYDIAKILIKSGKAYCDNTPLEQMRDQRLKCIESACRNKTPQQNMQLFEKMIKGEADSYVLRGKINYKDKNGTMRDPVFFRTIKQAHHRTGTKFSLYPTYDFACPVIDSLEGVTHAMRSNEYTDRVPQYHWILKNLEMRDVEIFQFSRLNFEYALLSKRKLQFLVDNKKVSGWDDPRFATFRGVLRKGLRVETLIEFMLEQGPSTKNTLMEWDKLWAINKGYIDNICPRYSAVSVEKACDIFIENGPKELQAITVPCFVKNPALGNRPQYRSSNVVIEFEDAKNINEGQKIILMGWSVMLVKSKQERPDGSFKFTVEILPEDKDFKTPPKLTWLCKDANLVQADLVEYDHLLKTPKVEDGDQLLDVMNDNSRFPCPCYVDPMIRLMKPGDFLQFQRRGYYKVDRVTPKQNGNYHFEIIYVPDGKKKGLASISRQTDIKGDIVRLDLDKKIENKKNKDKKGHAEGQEAQKVEKKKDKKKKEVVEDKKKQQGQQKPGEEKPAENQTEKKVVEAVTESSSQ